MPNQSDGRQIAEHKVGLPLALLPGYFFMGLSGVRVTLGFMAASGSALLFLLCLSLNFSRNLSLFGWALFSFSAPWWSHSQIAMTELPGGLCFLVVLAAFNGAIPRLWAPLACAALAWLNVRFFPVALALSLMDAYGRRREGWFKASIPVLITGLSLALALVFNLIEFGHLSPAESYTQRNMDAATIIKPLMIPRYICGLLIDQEFGWLPYCPVFALAFFGLWAQWLHKRALFWMTLLPALVYIGPVASFPWWISAMAPNRYMVFLTAVFVIWTLEAFKAWGARPIFAALAALTFFWGFTLTVLPWFCWGKQNGRNMILEIIGRPLHLNLPPWFPTFWMDDPKSYVWVILLLILAGLSAIKLGKPSAKA